jgi:uncharacterized damage-inducible protein DinB
MVALVEELPAEEGGEGDEQSDLASGDTAKDEEDEEDPESNRVYRSIDRPLPGEYAPSAAKYMELVPDDPPVLELLAANVRDTQLLALSIGEEAISRPYAPGKWTGKELLVHVSDDERIYSYRALRFARGDTTELPGFEEKDYARSSRANDRRLEDILRELLAVRQATIELFDALPDEALLRVGVADGHPMSVRAAAYHLAGHELHHVRFLREGYPEGAP